jgi:hypothetical protein
LFLQDFLAVNVTAKLTKSFKEEKASCPRKTCREAKDWCNFRALASSKQGNDSKNGSMIQIGKVRCVSVGNFKGKVLIDVREYGIDPKGEMKSGRKIWSCGTS